jgi:hypothetical protein
MGCLDVYHVGGSNDGGFSEVLLSNPEREVLSLSGVPIALVRTYCRYPRALESV